MFTHEERENRNAIAREAMASISSHSRSGRAYGGTRVGINRLVHMHVKDISLIVDCCILGHCMPDCGSEDRMWGFFTSEASHHITHVNNNG